VAVDNALDHPLSGPSDHRHPAVAALARWLPVIVLALVVVVHLPTLSAPLTDRHDFRQTQTAFTARIYHEEGIDLLHPKLPVLGPPWEIPFEFPLFQASAALVMDAGVAEDTALRATGLACFVLAGALLWLLVRRQAGRLGAGIALVVFATSPIAIEWSRAALIEYLALAMALAFALAGLRWRERPGPGWFAAALAFGILAALVKITTAAFWIAPFAILGCWRDDTPATTRSRIGAWALTILPLLAGLAWTRWADAIKAASEATAWLTSTGLVGWNFGTIEQRLEPDEWAQVVSHVVWLAGGAALLLLAVPIVVYAVRRRQVRFWVWIAGTLAGPVVVFFNLYWVHDYYATAVTASMAALVGVGFAALAAMRSPGARALLLAAAVVSVAVWVQCVSYWTRTFDPTSDPTGALPLAAQIERETSPDQYVAIVGRDWSPSVLYYAHRWGWMINSRSAPGLLEELLAEGYAVYRCPFTNETDHCDRITAPSGSAD
jgi:MFS family permease